MSDPKAAIYALEDLASQLHPNGSHVGDCISFGTRIRRHCESLGIVAGAGDITPAEARAILAAPLPNDTPGIAKLRRIARGVQ